jgi:acyl-homoserine-lactone acylase
MRSVLSTLVLTVAMTGCGGSSNNDLDDRDSTTEAYEATVQRTEFGIPHITADSYGNMGFGYGYAYAQDNFCVLMKEIVRANGESALLLGDDGDINQDFVYKLVNSNDFIEGELLPALSSDFADLLEGFAAGMNKHFGETGASGLAGGDEGCTNAAWAREITQLDMGKMLHKLILRASTAPLAEALGGQSGPTETVTTTGMSKAELSQQLASATPPEILPPPEVLGSNAYALGGDATESGSGLLLGNPHFPWAGSNRFYMVHLTIPGVYDAMGASLHGFPLVNIGFNDSIAWSHTVSTGNRFTLYELKLDTNDPLRYEYDGGFRDITQQTVTAQQVGGDGEIEDIEHTFYMSHYGPILDLSLLADELAVLSDWPTFLGTAYAVRDVNLGNLRGFDVWDGMAKASNMAELLEATKVIGNPWVNTVAVDKFGEALYADISTVPNVTQEQYDVCTAGPSRSLLTSFGLVTLDGSDSFCEWGSDADAPTDGILGFANLPKLQTRNHAANANDSYWLAAVNERLEGFSPLIGQEQYQQSLRTRLTFDQLADRFDNSDDLDATGLFNTEKLQQVMHSNRNLAAELVLDEVLTICAAVADWSGYTANTAETAEACSLLGGWDRKSDNDSVGEHIFLEFWRYFRNEANIFSVAFDANDPINTPNTLNVGDVAVVEAVKQNIADGVQRLLDAGIELNKPWGEVQFVERNGVRIPINGSTGAYSFSTISSNLVDGEGYSDIYAGNSYIQTVGWDSSDSACPDAFAVLTYSQSTDPASPHYADQTQLYADKQWVDMPFCADDIAASAIGDAEVITN